MEMPETVWRGSRYLSMKKLDEWGADRGEGGRGGRHLLSVWWRLWHCKKKPLQPIFLCKICGRGKEFKEPSLVDHNKDLINVPSHLFLWSLNFTQEWMHWGVKALLEVMVLIFCRHDYSLLQDSVDGAQGEYHFWFGCVAVGINHSLINCESIYCH